VQKQLIEVSFLLMMENQRAMIEPILIADIGCGSQLKMLSIGDDIVAETYRTSGARSFEPASLMLWFQLAKQSRYAMDVGAFTGIYALAAAGANSLITVAAIEPTKHVYSRLCLNIRINGFETQISPLNFAAGDRVGDCLLNHYDGIYCLGSGSTLLETGHRPFWFSETARMLPLDILPAIAACDKRFTVIELPQTGPEIVKIDVEGYEIAVLAGLHRTIQDFLPIFIIECLSEAAFDATFQHLHQFSYKPLLINDEQLTVTGRVEEYSIATRNVLFYPIVKKDDVQRICDGIDAGVRL
jgi:FkbM family methyltransferase